MGVHLIDGEFQSDKYPTTPSGKVPLSVKDRSAQDLLWEYAQRRRAVDAEFSADLEEALRLAGFKPRMNGPMNETATGDGGIVGEGGELQDLKVDIPAEVLEGKVDPDLIGMLRRFASRSGFGTSRMLQELLALWGARQGWRLHWDQSQDPLEYPEEELLALWNDLKAEERDSIRVAIRQQREMREVLDKSILDLAVPVFKDGLSAKTIGVLATESEIRTVGDLVRSTNLELRRIKGLGRGIREIVRVVDALGLTLAGQEPKWKRKTRSKKK